LAVAFVMGSFCLDPRFYFFWGYVVAADFPAHLSTP